jgi:hypothetical protein
MSHDSLTTRLRQQSRGTGLATAFVMALTMLLCLGGGIVIYAQLDPFTRDFVSASVTVTPERVAQAQTGADTTAQPTAAPAQDAEPTAIDADAQDIAPNDFVATHISNDEDAVNFREGPSSETTRLAELAPGTELKETGATDTDVNGILWREFETADGLVGWIRDVDAIPV